MNKAKDYLDSSRLALLDWLKNAQAKHVWKFKCPVYEDEATFKDVDDPNLFFKLTSNEQMELFNWCVTVMVKTQAINRNHTSYGIKHLFEEAPLGFYVTNGALKGAMLLAGFTASDIESNNWNFNVSEKSFKSYGVQSSYISDRVKYFVRR